MMRLARLVGFVVMLLSAGSIWSEAYYLDTPHNESNGIYCYTCHEMPEMLDPTIDWPGRAQINPDDTLKNYVCNSCHAANPVNTLKKGPAKKPHASSSTGSTIPWTTECTQCHDVHYQGQLDWSKDDFAKLYLVTGVFKTANGALSYTDLAHSAVGYDYTTIGFDPDPALLKAQDGFAEPATWKAKGGPLGLANMDPARAVDGSRGLILVPNKTNHAETFEITNVSGNVITVKGRMVRDAVNGGAFAIIYGQGLRSQVMPNGGSGSADLRDVKFFWPRVSAASAGGYIDDSGSSQPQGLCQVCHDSTAYWKNDGSSTAHNPGTVCGECHNILTGLSGGANHRNFIGDFLATGCGNCHSGQVAAPESGHSGGCNTCHVNPKPAITSVLLGNDGGLSVREALSSKGYSFGPRLTDGSGQGVGDTGFQVIDCSGCHQLKRAAVQAGTHGGHGASSFGWAGNCADCHGPTSKEVARDVHSDSCTICHDPARGAANDYSRRIVGNSSNGIDGSAIGATRLATCPDCHSGDIGTVHHLSQNRLAESSCTTGNATGPCHSATSHQGNHSSFVGDYVNCTACHAANVGRSSGAPVDLLDNKKHDDCAVCHNLNTTLKSLAQVSAARVVAMPAGGGNCASCHGEYFTRHSNVDHQTRVGGNVACNSCHAATVGTALTAPVNPADNQIHDSCATCHQATGVLHGAYGKASGMLSPGGDCTICHGSYFPGHQINHQTRVAGTGNCTGCHTDTAGLPGDMPVNASDNKVHDGCATCHDDQSNNLLKAASGKASAMPPGGGDCNACHGAYFVSHTNADHTSKVAINAGCVGCHEVTKGTSTGVPVDNLNNLIHDACTTCHDGTTGALVGLASGHNGGADCLTCHGSGGHDTVLDHNHRVTSSCSSCHAVGSPSAIDTLHNSCQTCHAYSGGLLNKATVDAAIAAGKDGFDQSCEACHTQHDSVTDHNQRQSVAACAVCHAVADALAVDLLHKNNCQTCHGYAGSKLNAATVAAVIATGKGVSGTPVNCQSCHVATAISTIHHATEAAANGNCTISCHQTVDHSATVKDGATPVCLTCHTTTAGTATGAPVSLTDPAIHDSCFTCHKFDGNKRGILVNFTNSKGVTGSGTLPNGGTIGGKNGGGACTACHTVADRKAYHHNSPRMAVGQCETCHIDPRSTWDSSLVGDNGIASGLPRPTQMACLKCHIDFTSSPGNMLVKKYTRSDYSSYRTDWTRSTIHTIPTTAMRINNYGICLSCHYVGSSKGGVAPMRLWHPQPSKSYPWTFYDQTESGKLGKTAYRSHVWASHNGDQAHYVPGRSANTTDPYPRSGIGGFNIFAPNYGIIYRPDDYQDYPGADYANVSRSSYTGNADDTPNFVRVNVPTVSQLANPLSASLNSTTRAVPVFASLAPLSAAPVAADNVKVKSAVYDSAASTLTVVASTSNPAGCSTLKMVYGASNQTMSDAGSTPANCIKTISTVTYPYPATGTTVDVTTTNTSGIGVKGYRISTPNPGVIVFSAPTFVVAENGTSATIMVSRTIGSTGAVAVDYAAIDGGTAVADSHFASFTPATLDWAAGDTSDKAIAISINDDQVYGGEKTLLIELSAPTNGATLGNPATALLTIVDDETSAGTIAFTSANYSVTEEGGAAALITATRSGGSTGAVSVSYANTAGSSATAWGDFVPASGSLAWADGETGSKSFTINIYDDTKVEGTYPDWNEKVNLTISNPTNGALLGSPNLAVLTINDAEKVGADQGLIAFSAATYGVLENIDPYTAGSVTITAHRSRGYNGPVSVNYAATAGGTATAGSDFTAFSGTLSWADGEWYDKSFTINMLNNYVYEGTETINLAITAPANPTLLASPNTAVVSINDEDDRYGVIALTSATYLVDEDGPTGKATITATRTNGANGAVSVSYAKTTSTATAGADYTNFSGTLSWATRDTASKSFDITIANDGLTDPNETITFALSAPTGGATLATPSTATLTINDDEGKKGTIVLTSATYSVNENEATGKVVITAYRFGGSSGAVSVDYAAAAGTAPGSLFTANSGTLNWAAGQSGYQTFEITIHDNVLFEGDQTVDITLANPTNGATLAAPSTAVLTIVDNDSNFVFSSPTYSNREGATIPYITVKRLGAKAAAVSVNYATTSDGTATVDTDFTSTSGTLSWPANNNSDKTFTIPINNDIDPEESETVNIVLSSPAPVGSTSLVAPSTAVLTIVDNDHPGVIAFKAATYEVDENDPARSVRIIASRTGGSDGAVGVSCGLTGGTATLNTDFSTNFSQGLGTLSWGDGDAADKSYEISLYPDNTWEGSGAETVTLALSSPTGGAVLASPVTTVLTIDDREDWPGTFALTSSAYTAAEDGGSATITATRTGGYNGEVSVRYYTYAGGTATANVDYSSTSGNLVWPAGDTTNKSFAIPLSNDAAVEGDETVYLKLASINYGGGNLGSPDTAVLTIVNDEGKNGAIALSSPTYTVAEDGLTATIIVTRSGGSTGAVSVDYATSGGTATVAADYASTSGSHTWLDGESGSWSFTVPIQADLLTEGDETFYVTLSNPTGGATLGVATAAVTIEGLAVKELDHWPTTPQLTAAGAVNFTVAAGQNRLLMVAINASGASGATTTGQTFSATYGGVPLIQAALQNTNAYAQTWIGYLPEAGIIARSGDSLSISVNGAVNGIAAYIASYENVNQDFPVAASGGTYSRTSGSYITPAPLPVGAGGYAIFNWAQPQYLTMTWSSVSEGYVSDANFSVNGRRTGIASKSFASAAETWPIVYANPYYYVSYSLVTLNKFGGGGAPGVISLKDSSWSVSETGGPVSITAKRTGGYNGPVQVNYGVVGGTGVAGFDYSGGTGTLAWADNDMADKVFPIEILDNGVYSVGKTINLALSSPTGGAVLGNPSTGVVSIVNDDPMVQGSVAFSSPTYTVSEGDAVASMTVSRTGGIDGAVGVHYDITGGTAVWNAGGDYMYNTGNLAWADGDGADKIINITILDDLDDDGDKTVNFALTSPTGGVLLGSPAAAVLTITDNEASPAIIALTSATFTVNENGGLAQITVSRSGNSVGAVQIHCGTGFIAGTAQSGWDYENRGAYLDWADGDMADKSFDLIINDNAEYGVDKSVTLQILEWVQSGNAVFGAQRSMTLTIINDDPFLDADGDLVEDRFDLCANTTAAQSVDVNGCALSQLDSDHDGVTDDLDQCPFTPGWQPVNASGCDDTDQDGISDSLDLCAATPPLEPVNANGCGLSQLDADGDGVSDLADQCPGTGAGLTVDVNGCTVAAGYLLPDTGQTQSFTEVFGEDHDYPLHPLSYTVVGATVVDQNTGLIWQRQDDDLKRNWADAITYCNELTLATQSDWRLPTRHELSSLLHMGRHTPAIDPLFVGTNCAAASDDRYWSSTPTAIWTAAAWSSHYYDQGGDSWMQQKTSTAYVRCVRGGM